MNNARAARDNDRDDEIQRRGQFTNEPAPRRGEVEPDREVKRHYESEPRPERRSEPSEEPRRRDEERR